MFFRTSWMKKTAAGTAEKKRCQSPFFQDFPRKNCAMYLLFIYHPLCLSNLVRQFLEPDKGGVLPWAVRVCKNGIG